MSRWAAVLAGGSGTRFWPLSTSRSPKQMLSLTGSESLLAQAVRRLSGLIPPERILVITAEALCEATLEVLPELPPKNILAEPRAASTGPALVWATHRAQESDPDATLLSLHADWFVGDDAAFRETARRAMDVADRFDVLVAVGVVPSRPDVGYGYIVPGEVLDGDVRVITRFVEKPDAERATRLMREGALWNSGLFAWTARRFFLETEALAPEIAPHLTALRAGDVARYFREVRPIAVDVSHFERSRRVAVLPGRFPWDDVGTWAALARVRATDAAGNTSVGDVTAVDTAGTVAWADGGPVVLFGVRDLVVVRANSIVLVTTTERAAHLKDLLSRLPPPLRDPVS
ncbi:MAG: mannose-1-phosphate guanylyltransferase [Gemmatimonadetes bacterium]|nr:mannose-1-phosphate guanylyltransferase [Gemmatimonadota bacterium]